MIALFLAAFVGGLLLSVRLMFFGAERRRLRSADALPLRWSEPASVAFLVMSGLVGYLALRNGTFTPSRALGLAVSLGALFALVATRLAIATARVQPEHDPEDPRFRLQGRVGVVTRAIPAGGDGVITFDEEDGEARVLPARDLEGRAIAHDVEICIERVDDGVALVEPWAAVEQRL